MTGVVKYGQDSGALMALAAVCLALLTILTVWRLRRFKYTLVNETGGALLYGMLLGLLVRCLSWDWGKAAESGVCSCEGLNATSSMLMVNISSGAQCYQSIGRVNQRCPPVWVIHMETFDPEVLFNLFLPPIIFYGAYTLNQKRFFENLGSILTFAFFGTIISFLIIGASVYGFTRLMVLLGRAADGDFLLTHCLLFGAIMSATDPVSVVGLLGKLRVDPALHALLFGESVLNDAVAIVLTHAVAAYSQMGAGHAFNPAAFFLSVGYFVGVFAGSLLLGLAFTAITALLTKLTRLHESPLLETSVFLLLSWCSFLSAEACRLSGIVAVLFCGLSQARYTALNLSSEARIRTKQLFEVFNFLGEIFIFSYMGCVLLTFPEHVFKALFISGAFLSVVVSRACHVYPLSFLLNARRSGAVPRPFQHFMTLAGTRGVVAFSLAVKDTSSEAGRAILSSTLLLVCVTVWVLGVAVEPALRRLDIRVGVDADENADGLLPEDASGRPDTTRTLWHRLDSQYPFFVFHSTELHTHTHTHTHTLTHSGSHANPWRRLT